MNSAPGQKEGEPGLIFRSRFPENLESPLGVIDSWLTPNEMFYLRNHHGYPSINSATWQLTLGGHVEFPLALSYQQVINLPMVSSVNVLECAGNRRSYFEPNVPGEQWDSGAIGNAKWTGVSLTHILSMVKLKPGVREIVFTGSDSGPRPDMPGNYVYARSMAVQDIFQAKPILALFMNDVPLPYKHGFPLRLIVPGWYGMASVKWLRSIAATTKEFLGPYQRIDYVYLPQQQSYTKAEPVRKIKVNSIITYPRDQAVLKPGSHLFKGLAWAGEGAIARIEVSKDGGVNWVPVSAMSKEHTCLSWVLWEYRCNLFVPGKYTFRVRAMDDQGNIQPLSAPWNNKGYGNNSIHSINLTVPNQIDPQL